jgi:hypothetical protein
MSKVQLNGDKKQNPDLQPASNLLPSPAAPSPESPEEFKPTA